MPNCWLTTVTRKTREIAVLLCKSTNSAQVKNLKYFYVKTNFGVSCNSQEITLFNPEPQTTAWCLAQEYITVTNVYQPNMCVYVCVCVCVGYVCSMITAYFMV